SSYLFFFFNDTATTEIYTLSLHDALPISDVADEVADEHAGGHPEVPIVDARLGEAGHRNAAVGRRRQRLLGRVAEHAHERRRDVDRKSTRLNSSHDQISYAVFCLKKKKKQ